MRDLWDKRRPTKQPSTNLSERVRMRPTCCHLYFGILECNGLMELNRDEVPVYCNQEKASVCLYDLSAKEWACVKVWYLFSREISVLAMHNEILEDDSEVIQGTGGRTALEMRSYLSEAQIPSREQPLVYRRTNTSRFPVLTKVAQALPCTSVDSECLFSSAYHVLDEK
ncbi:hypothetical protein C0J45_20782 [Silurus meridionalis]|nr:hypothetical protein C0J45_20782 [Silurus meridionalis]